MKCKLCGHDKSEFDDGMCCWCWEMHDRILKDPELAAKVLRGLSPPPEFKIESEGWHGVDLDGTLAVYDGWKGVDHIGAPVPKMVERVKAWLAASEQVRIMTARVHPNQDGRTIEVVRYWIEKWCLEHIGQVLPITHEKDFGMIDLYDDRVVQVEKNTGRTVVEQLAPELTKIKAAVDEIFAEMGGKRAAKWDVANEGFLALESLQRRARGG